MVYTQRHKHIWYHREEHMFMTCFSWEFSWFPVSVCELDQTNYCPRYHSRQWANAFRLAHIYIMAVHCVLFFCPCLSRGWYSCCQLKWGKCQSSVWHNNLGVIYHYKFTQPIFMACYKLGSLAISPSSCLKLFILEHFAKFKQEKVNTANIMTWLEKCSCV